MKRSILFLLLLLLTAGCARLPFTPAPAMPTRPLTADVLLQGLWTGGDRIWRIRQTVLFELHGAKVPMDGFLRLDSGRGEARLVGLNDLGVKLFDLAVTVEGHEEHYLFPELARIPGVSGAIAGAVRHIFLEPQPAVSDSLEIGTTEYRLNRGGTERRVLFIFGGPGANLLEKRVQGDGEAWRARYFDYRPVGAAQVPGGILLEDERGGYRLTLWLEEVKADD